MTPPAEVIWQLPLFLSAINPDGTLAWSSRYEYGYDRDGLVGRPADVPIVEADRPAWWAAFRLARDGRQVAPYAVRVVAPGTPGLPAGEVRIAGRMYPVIVDNKVKWVGAVAWDVGLDAGPPPPPPPAEQLVTLNQMAAICRRKKVTLRRLASKLPPPAMPGRRGQVALWRWADVRPVLAAHYRCALPERYPEIGL